MRPERARALAVFLPVFAYLGAEVGAWRLLPNELEKLPIARQLVQPDWIPSDWFLNLGIGYRLLFGTLVGPLCTVVSFETAARILRVLFAAGFAGAVARQARSFGLSPWLAVPWVAFFLENQNLVAGEWMLGAAETKSPAYIAVLFALPAAYDRRYTATLAFLGLALSFHALVGIFAAASFLPVLLSREGRSLGTVLLRRSWVYAATGAFGLFAVGQELWRRRLVDPETAREWMAFHVIHRLPHHAYPPAWEAEGVPRVLAWTALLVVFAWWGDPPKRFLARYGLGSLLFFAAGLGVHAAGQTHWLAYYWFRFADTMVPFLGSLCVALVASDLLAGRAAAVLPARWRLPVPGRRAARGLAAGVAALLLLWVGVPYLLDASLRVGPAALWPAPHTLRDTDGRRAMHWIRDHAPPDARFLADPTLAGFYAEAQRAILVTWKHAPQSALHFPEWWERLQRVNGGPVRSQGFEGVGLELRRGFLLLGPAEVLEIARRYDLDHVLTVSPFLPFPEVHREGKWRVLALPEGDGSG